MNIGFIILYYVFKGCVLTLPNSIFPINNRPLDLDSVFVNMFFLLKKMSFRVLFFIFFLLKINKNKCRLLLFLRTNFSQKRVSPLSGDVRKKCESTHLEVEFQLISTRSYLGSFGTSYFKKYFNFFF